MSDDNSSFLFGRAQDPGWIEDTSEYIADHMIEREKFNWTKNPDGESVLALTKDDWALLTDLQTSVYYDDGAGYVDLGLDNLFEIDPNTGLLIADTEGTWMAINGQPVPYYHETSDQISDTEWRITGRVPCLLNGSRADLLLVFDQDHETGYVAGARSVYEGELADAVAKNMTGIAEGDEIVFLADLYDYNQNYTDSYRFGSPITVQGELTVSDVILPDASKTLATYRFTDIYNQAYWTPVIGK